VHEASTDGAPEPSHTVWSLKTDVRHFQNIA